MLTRGEGETRKSQKSNFFLKTFFASNFFTVGDDGGVGVGEGIVVVVVVGLDIVASLQTLITTLKVKKITDKFLNSFKE